jgi:hypothetical protein
MDIMPSAKRKDASNSFLKNFMGGLKGTTVNLFMPPITVERAGCEAMLNFGLALALEAPAFTFPRAINLKGAGDRVIYGGRVEEGIARDEHDQMRQASGKRD